MKSNLKVNSSSVMQGGKGWFLCGAGLCWVFSLGNAGVWTTPRLMGKYLKGVCTDRVMYERRKPLMQSTLCQICLKLLFLLWKEKKQRQNADLCEAHSSSKKMYSVFLSCYYSLSRNRISSYSRFWPPGIVASASDWKILSGIHFTWPQNTA